MKQDEDWTDYASPAPDHHRRLRRRRHRPVHHRARPSASSSTCSRPRWTAGKVDVPHDRGPDHREPRRSRTRRSPTTCSAEIKKCHVILKGPTTTPAQGRPLAQHRERATSRCARSWTSSPTCGRSACPSRASTGSSSARTPRTSTRSGSNGIDVDRRPRHRLHGRSRRQGTRPHHPPRLRARQEERPATRSPCVTKANVVKTTDGKFLDIAQEIAKEYPERRVRTTGTSTS